MLLALTLLTLAPQALAQEGQPVQLTPALDLRMRAANGLCQGISEGCVDRSGLLERSRLGLHAQRGMISARVGVQQYTGWQPTDDGGFQPLGPVIAFHESVGIIDVPMLGDTEFRFEAGRQQLTIHRGRLLSAYSFSAAGNSIDAFVNTLAAGRFHYQVVTFSDLEAMAEGQPKSSGVVVIGWSDTTPVLDWTADVVALTEFSPDGRRATVGLFGSWAWQRWNLGTEGYSQQTEQDGLEDTWGWMGSGWLGLTVGPERLFAGTLQLDWYPALGPWITAEFDAPLGDHHRFLGHMDLFVGPADRPGMGLQDAQLATVLRPIHQVEVLADLHRFSHESMTQALGWEFDLGLRYRSPFLTVEGGVFLFAEGPGYAGLGAGHAPSAASYVQTEFEF
jgi:hypothetical protein